MQDIRDGLEEEEGPKLASAHMAPRDVVDDGTALGMGAWRVVVVVVVVGRIGLEASLSIGQDVLLEQRMDAIPFRSVADRRSGHHPVRAHGDQDLNARRAGKALAMSRVLVGFACPREGSLSFSWSRWALRTVVLEAS